MTENTHRPTGDAVGAAAELRQTLNSTVLKLQALEWTIERQGGSVADLWKAFDEHEAEFHAYLATI